MAAWPLNARSPCSADETKGRGSAAWWDVEAYILLIFGEKLLRVKDARVSFGPAARPTPTYMSRAVGET